MSSCIELIVSMSVMSYNAEKTNFLRRIVESERAEVAELKTVNIRL